MQPDNYSLGIPSAAEFISLQIHIHNTTFISMQISSDSPIPLNISWYTMTVSSLDVKFILKCLSPVYSACYGWSFSYEKLSFAFAFLAVTSSFTTSAD